MIELIIGLLSTLVPLILNTICDKMDHKEDNKLEGLDNEINNLTDAESDEDVAIAWGSHDYRLRALLREAKQKQSERS